MGTGVNFGLDGSLNFGSCRNFAAVWDSLRRAAAALAKQSGGAEDSECHASYSRSERGWHVRHGKLSLFVAEPQQLRPASRTGRR